MVVIFSLGFFLDGLHRIWIPTKKKTKKKREDACSKAQNDKVSG